MEEAASDSVDPKLTVQKDEDSIKDREMKRCALGGTIASSSYSNSIALDEALSLPKDGAREYEGNIIVCLLDTFTNTTTRKSPLFVTVTYSSTPFIFFVFSPYCYWKEEWAKRKGSGLSGGDGQHGPAKNKVPSIFSQTHLNIAGSNSFMNLLSRLVGLGSPKAAENMNSATAQGPDDDMPAPGQKFAQFGAGCFWGVELAFQRASGVTKTEVGYSQGNLHNPSYESVCTGTTHHSEIVRVQYDPNECSYESLLDVFWARHDPTTLNRQGNDVGSQYRSGIYYYTPEQEKAAIESLEQQQKKLNRKIVTEILPAKKFYRAEEYHQQYLEKGGRFGSKQSAAKGCNDPIRCYG
ncbi:hypothetical protein VNO78_27583 [Psophocarpus tetragonolobus]|uniref:peptide-methionine (S)-S-oxide reductase n=1 Tax=Psophocarpus tetragonolobus TaxID=3891 RepID=A0AAN9S0Q3_PSOTE